MGNDLIEQVRAIQNSMVESGRPHLSGSELEDLRCLIRITVEFQHYLQRKDLYSTGEPIDSLDQKEANYRGDSILGGIESFWYLSGSFHLMATTKMTAWTQMSIQALKQRFASLYEEFSVEADFERRCRLLLDLYKLQIIFVGLSYR